MQLEGDVIKTPPTQKSMRAIWNGVTSILLPAGVFMYWPYMVPVLGYSVPSLLAVMGKENTFLTHNILNILATYHGVNKFF